MKDSTLNDPCRCGWASTQQRPHPCHRCGKPAVVRFYSETEPWSLAGLQMKTVVRDTVGCDSCWAEFQKVQAVLEDQARLGKRPQVPAEWTGTMTYEQVFGPKKSSER